MYSSWIVSAVQDDSLVKESQNNPLIVFIKQASNVINTQLLVQEEIANRSGSLDSWIES